MGVLRNGLNLLGISSFLQQVVIGLVIIGAVLVDSLLKTPARPEVNHDRDTCTALGAVPRSMAATGCRRGGRDRAAPGRAWPWC